MIRLGIIFVLRKKSKSKVLVLSYYILYLIADKTEIAIAKILYHNVVSPLALFVLYPLEVSHYALSTNNRQKVIAYLFEMTLSTF